MSGAEQNSTIKIFCSNLCPRRSLFCSRLGALKRSIDLRGGHLVPLLGPVLDERRRHSSRVESTAAAAAHSGPLARSIIRTVGQLLLRRRRRRRRSQVSGIMRMEIMNSASAQAAAAATTRKAELLNKLELDEKRRQEEKLYHFAVRQQKETMRAKGAGESGRDRGPESSGQARLIDYHFCALLCSSCCCCCRC